MKEFFVWLMYFIAIVACCAGLAVCLTVLETQEREQLKQDIRQVMKEVNDENI